MTSKTDYLKRNAGKEFWKFPLPYPLKYALLDNEEKIAYLDSEKGKQTVVLLHGHFNCSYTMIEYMKALAPTMRCIAPCLRGYGLTSYK